MSTAVLNRFESLNKTTKRKLDTRSWPWIVDEKNRGTIGLNTEMVVMNVIADPKHNGRHKVTYFVTENGSLFAGNNTVALFKIKSLSPQFKAFFNQTNSSMQMDPNAPVQEQTENNQLTEETTASVNQEVATDAEGTGDLAE